MPLGYLLIFIMYIICAHPWYLNAGIGHRLSKDTKLVSYKSSIFPQSWQSFNVGLYSVDPKASFNDKMTSLFWLFSWLLKNLPASVPYNLNIPPYSYICVYILKRSKDNNYEYWFKT